MKQQSIHNKLILKKNYKILNKMKNYKEIEEWEKKISFSFHFTFFFSFKRSRNSSKGQGETKDSNNVTITIG